jgi:photosystem II stability/assembly factor-like uncharacterized protein
MSRRTTVCAAILACACSPLPPDGSLPGTMVGGGGGQQNGSNSGFKGPDIVVKADWINVTANLGGLPSECGNLSWLSEKPDEDMLIVGVALHGLYSSVGGAPTWSELGTGPGSDRVNNRTDQILYDPDHPQTFWEAGTYGSSVFRTDDDGVTFKKLGDINSSDSIGVDFTDPQRKTLLAGSHERPNILYRSTDGGMTWTDIGPTIQVVGYASLTHVVNAQIHLLGTNGVPGAGIYRTTDGGGGAPWTRVWDQGVRGHPMVAPDGTMFWVLENRGGIIASKDQGATWTKRGGMEVADSNRVNTAIVMFPDGRLVTLGYDTLIISADGGATWRKLGPKIPFQSWGFTYSRHRKAFYAWYATCQPTEVPMDAIRRLDFDWEKQ